MSAPSGQQVFADLVVELITAEDKRRDSLEARGSGVISASGALVALLLAIGALVTDQDSFVLTDAAGLRLSLAAIAFVAAAILAIGTYAPQAVRLTSGADLANLLPTYWDKGADFALKKATATRLEQLAVAQRSNDLKARLLTAAIAVQVIAVGFLCWTVLAIL
jgi:hypothetical protein